MSALPKITNTKPHIERRIHRGLEESRGKRDAKHAPGLMLSAIGQCPRNLWAALHGIPEESPPEGRTLMIFALGDAIEAHVITLLRTAGFVVSDRDPETSEQYQVRAYDGRVRGRLDGKVLLGQDRFDQALLLEIKSAKASKFEELVAGGSYESWNPGYADTLHAYMGWGQIDQALVVVYCKDDSRLWAEKIRFDLDRFTRLRLKAEYVLGAEQVVVRPEQATSQYCGFCKWCPRSEWCWGPLADTRFDS